MTKISFLLFLLFCLDNKTIVDYNSFLVYCRELAPGTVSLTGDRAKGDDSKHDSHYNCRLLRPWSIVKYSHVDITSCAMPKSSLHSLRRKVGLFET